MLDQDLQRLALLIDSASKSGDLHTLTTSLDTLGKLQAEDLDPLSLAQVHFYTANCHSAIRRISGESQSWSWQNPELEKEIYSLRCARKHIESVEFINDRSDLRFRISTNLANALNHVGRVVEAVSLWDEVLSEHPEYPMSVANRGYAFFWYGQYLYDPGHQGIFFNESYHEIKRALSLGVESHAENDLRQWLNTLLKMDDWESFDFKPQDESRGRSETERSYRTWALENRLFLNPLNDLWCKDIAANDVLTFPSIIVDTEDLKIGNPPEVYGIFNQLKQEYVSARYMLFDAVCESSNGVHFSDKRVKLYDLMDYRCYRLWIEKTKMAFLSAHAIFDKIAYLVNEYWQLALGAREISLKRCWFAKGKRSELAPPFESSRNWALRGLFWLSKDLAGERGSSQPIQPDAWHISEIRNHIAHKYLKVFDHMLVDTEGWRQTAGHEYEYPISDQELIYRTRSLLELVRAALIYVTLAASHEERIKKETIGSKLLAEMGLMEIGDKDRL